MFNSLLEKADIETVTDLNLVDEPTTELVLDVETQVHGLTHHGSVKIVASCISPRTEEVKTETNRLLAELLLTGTDYDSFEDDPFLELALTALRHVIKENGKAAKDFYSMLSYVAKDAQKGLDLSKDKDALRFAKRLFKDMKED